MAEKVDYAQIAYLVCTESAANTLTYSTLNIGQLSLLGDKFAMVIHRAEFELDDWSTLNGTGDLCAAGITVSNALSAITLNYAEVITRQIWKRLDLGVAASGSLEKLPVVRDFGELPGAGLIVPADRLYLAVKSEGATAANTVKVRLYYTLKSLKPEEYWQLVESRTILTT